VEWERRRLFQGVRRPALEDSHTSYNPGIETTVDPGKGGQRFKISHSSYTQGVY
jgi:hypothetical protein